MSRSEALWTTAIVVAFVAIVAIGRLWHSSIQVDVYRRQGVEMTTFEVFMGAKPVERYIKQ